MVAVCTVAVTFVAVKLAMLPVPDAARPMLVFVFVQLYTVPGTLPVKLTAAVAVPLHSTCDCTAFTVGTGFTVMVKVCDVPVQVTPPLVKLGVTTMVPVNGAPVVLVAVKLRLPVPLAARPMAVLLLVQLYTVPATGPVKACVTVTPAHTTWLATGFTDGFGFTVIVNVIGVPGQVTPLLKFGVTVIVATCGMFVALMAVKLAILPAPAAARPMLVLLFVQL